MAQTFTTAAMGSAANDGSGNGIRTGGLKIAADLEELYTDVAALQGSIVTIASILRGDNSLSYTSGTYSVTFTAEFVSNYEVFINSDGVGYTISNKASTGFDIEFLEACTFGYVCIVIP